LAGIKGLRDRGAGHQLDAWSAVRSRAGS
jgi:hypothetical protein